MAAPRGSLLLLLITLLSAGCRGTPPPVAGAEQTPPAAAPATPPTSPTSPATPAAPAATAATAKDPNRDDAPVVVDPGDDESSSPRTLVQAARAEKERRARAGAPAAIVINDKNLHQYAAKGQITVADPKTKKAATAAPAASAIAAADPAVRDEQHWRGHALEIRLRWRAAADEVKKLEQRSAELRQRFYSENDSYVRDNQVKPEWDRVTDRLQKARTETEAARQELASFLDEGRRAGALPGWLREGEEQEPAVEPVKKKNGMPAPQSIEPPVLNQNDGGPPAWR